MDDLISRRELKSIIHNKAFDVANTNQYYNALRWCISVIDNMPSAQRWIPCSERLPESEKPPTEKKKYLAINKYSKEVDIYFWNGKTWIRRLAEYRADEIESWMELPYAYKE